MASLIERPDVAAFLAKVEDVARCAVVAPLVPGTEPTVGSCHKPMPCPDHGAAMLERLGFNPNIRQPREGELVTEQNAEPNTDIGAQPDAQPDQQAGDENIEADQVDRNDDATDADEG